MRFAGQLARLFPKMTKGEALMRFAPDALSAGFTAASLPEGTDPGMRLLAGLEDMAIGGLSGYAAGGLAEGGVRAFNRRYGKNLNPGQIGTIADMATSMGASMTMPRPAYNTALEQMYERERQVQEAQQAFEEQQLQQHLAFGGLTAGYGLGGYGLGRMT